MNYLGLFSRMIGPRNGLVNNTLKKVFASRLTIYEKFSQNPRAFNSLFNQSGECFCPALTQYHATNKIQCTVETRRYYNKKKTVKRPPTKPLTFGPHIGELDSHLEPLDLSQPRIGFEGIPELQNVDEVVKRIFSLEMADGQELKEKRMRNIVDQVKEHPADLKSIEVQIAELTVHIRHQMKHQLQFRKDKKSKITLFHRIQKRNSLIEKLRKTDFEKFEWLLKELKIKYTPFPEYNFKTGKRVLRKRAARNKFLAVKKAKLEEFRKQLAEEKVLFEEVKQRELQRIEKELKELGIHDKMTSLQETLEALDLGEPYVIKPVKRMKRRHEILAKKFELYGVRGEKKNR